MRHPTASVSINAAATVAAAPSTVFEFLADPVNQCWLSDDWIDVLGGSGTPPFACTEIALRDRRGRWTRAALRLLGTNRPKNLLMLLDVRGGPRAFVLWEIAPADGEHADPEATRVKLQAVVQPARLRDRLRLMAGGTRWLHDRARLALVELGHALGTEPDQPAIDAGLAR